MQRAVREADRGGTEKIAASCRKRKPCRPRWGSESDDYAQNTRAAGGLPSRSILMPRLCEVPLAEVDRWREVGTAQ